MTNALTITDLQKELLAVKQTYNELHCHDQRKMLALDDVPVFELTIDKEAKITNLSKGFEKVMEYTCEDYLNKSFTELLADEDEITGHYANFEMFKVKGTIYKKHWRMKKPSGEVITVMHSARAIYDDCGEFNGAVGFVLDVSASVNANRALVRSEREKRLILDIMSEGVIYFDKELKVIWANRVMSDFFGSFADDIENKRCREFCPGRNTGCATCPIMKSLHTKTKQISEVSYNSISCVMQVHPVLDNDEDIISLVTVITDITERKLLERQIVDLSNNERKRIGHDLHDGLGQMLSAISIMSSSLLDIMDKKEGQEFELVQKIVKHTDESQEMMRRILDGLCPVFDGVQDFGKNIESLASRQYAVYKVKCNLTLSHEIEFEDENIGNHLYMIIREALNNAVKHSKCTEIDINIYKENENIFIQINDNGVGVDELKSDQGYGFRIMRYRASVIGATLDITSRPPSGTKISIKL